MNYFRFLDRFVCSVHEDDTWESAREQRRKIGAVAGPLFCVCERSDKGHEAGFGSDSEPCSVSLFGSGGSRVEGGG